MALPSKNNYFQPSQPSMNRESFRHALLYAMLGGMLVTPQALAQSLLSESQGVLRSTPQNIEDLLKIEQRLKEVLPKVLPALVCLQVKDGSGTGIFINAEGEIYTAAHVVFGEGTPMTIVMNDGTRMPGTCTMYHKKTDAGKAKPNEVKAPVPFVTLAKNPPRIGDWVFSLGHGGGLDEERGAMVRLGRVVSLKHEAIQTDCKLIRGDSGGPLFNMNGELIGINSRVGTKLEDNLHVPMIDFTDPKRHQKEEAPSEAQPPASPAPASDEQKPATTQPTPQQPTAPIAPVTPVAPESEGPSSSPAVK